MALSKRQKMQKAMVMLVNGNRTVHYRQLRPMRSRYINTLDELHAAIQRGMSLDCSESYTLLCHIAGFRDPNGQGYNGWGFTGTILEHCKPHFTAPKDANIGTALVCGPGAGDHVMAVYKPGNDPLLFSHGTEGDPKFVRYSAIVPYLRSPATFCSIAKLG
jgi:hypothetical protein